MSKGIVQRQTWHVTRYVLNNIDFYSRVNAFWYTIMIFIIPHKYSVGNILFDCPRAYRLQGNIMQNYPALLPWQVILPSVSLCKILPWQEYITLASNITLAINVILASNMTLASNVTLGFKVISPRQLMLPWPVVWPWQVMLLWQVMLPWQVKLPWQVILPSDWVSL